MITLTAPTDARLGEFAVELDSRPLSYTPGLLDRVDDVERLPGPMSSWTGDGWFVDRFSEIVGHGPTDFAAAEIALREWAMFDQSWTRPVRPSVPIEVGATVTYSARVVGLWWGYGCRILDVVDEVRRFGFTYGTIDGHAEKGEELFQVELLDDGDVAFSLFAMSRPGRWFAWPGLPIARRAQRRFRPAAAAGMRYAIASLRPSVVT